MSLVFPLWREALGAPVCVVVWRDPMAVARSLATRDGLSLLASLALWEHSTRSLLRDSEGLPRVLVSYEQLLEDPSHIAGELHAALTCFGIEGLAVLPDERLRQIVNPEFNRSGRTGNEPLLDDGQRALLADLATGAALTKPAGPTPAHTLQLLADNSAQLRELARLNERLRYQGELLESVFASRGWRIARRLMGMRTLLRRRGAVTTEDRWRALRPE
jgi:hypothetical protein